MPGVVKFLITEAHLKKDVNLVLDMCPNYVIEFHGKKVKGPKAYGGGKNPTWSDFYTIDHTIPADVNWGGKVKIIFNNESDFICGCAISFEELVKRNNEEHDY